MLFSLGDDPITSIPRRRKADFDRWRSRLSDADYRNAIDGIRARLDGKEFVVSSFLPGSDWTHNEFQPLYLACNRNVQQSGWFFGLICWQAMIDHEDDWCFLPSDKDEDEVLGMRYFRRQR